MEQPNDIAVVRQLCNDPLASTDEGALLAAVAVTAEAEVPRPAADRPDEPRPARPRRPASVALRRG